MSVQIPTMTKKLGRPFTRDWQAEKPILEAMCAAGHSTYTIAQYYNLSQVALFKTLRRLGLRTKQGKARDARRKLSQGK